MKGLKNILLLITLLVGGTRVAAQPQINGIVYDQDTQLVIDQLVQVYTDTAGTPYPYFDTARTGINGSFNFVLPQNIPQGAIFRVKTTACNTPHISGGFLYPFTTLACNFMICNTNKYISGTVFKDTSFADTAIVYLLRRRFDSVQNSHSIVKIDSQYLFNQTGFYNFKLPLAGNDSYFVKAAILPISTQYLDFLPAYHTNSALNWNAALVIPKQNTTANIVMPPTNMMGGQGYISGTVLEGANKSSSVGDSLYKRILILTTINDVPVAFRYSNTDGTFSFGALNYDTYKLFGDALGKYNPPLIFALSANCPSLTDITFEEDSTSFMGSMWPLSVDNELADVLSVYPNPVQDELSIAGLDRIAGEKSINLLSMTGQVVYSQVAGNNAKTELQIASLPPGLYVLDIKTAKGSYIYKISK
jgi:hypothetical protein